MMLLNLNYFTMLWNLFVMRSVLFILERLRILNRSFNLYMMNRGCHVMDFNILTINRHWLNNVNRGLYDFYMVSWNRHCDITFIRV